MRQKHNVVPTRKLLDDGASEGCNILHKGIVRWRYAQRWQLRYKHGFEACVGKSGNECVVGRGLVKRSMGNDEGWFGRYSVVNHMQVESAYLEDCEESRSYSIV